MQTSVLTPKVIIYFFLLSQIINGALGLLNGLRDEEGHWVDTWTSMPQLTEPANLPPPPFNGTTGVFVNSTVRQTLHMSVGGSRLRIRISNAFGANDLHISAVTVALPHNGAAGESAIQPETLKNITFSGDVEFSIPSSAQAVSDPIDFTIAPQSMLAVTVYLASGQQGFSITSHPGSRTTTWMAFGDQVSSENLTDASVASVAHWYFLSAVETWATPASSSFVILGDSITDGRGSDDNKNNRWPDLVLARIQSNSTTSDIAVVNQAAGGNRILNDGLGPNLLSRIDRDVLAHPGVRYAMVFEGVNDIGTTPSTTEDLAIIEERVIWAYKQIVTRIHDDGIPVFAATVSPLGNPNSTVDMYYTPAREATRQRINDFIRNSGLFDAVIDFDAFLRDPTDTARLNPIYNSGDFLHPNVAGYQHIADLFPLSIFS